MNIICESCGAEQDEKDWGAQNPNSFWLILLPKSREHNYYLCKDCYYMWKVLKGNMWEPQRVNPIIINDIRKDYEALRGV